MHHSGPVKQVDLLIGDYRRGVERIRKIMGPESIAFDGIIACIAVSGGQEKEFVGGNGT
jgi:hypothetical protein